MTFNLVKSINIQNKYFYLNNNFMLYNKFFVLLCITKKINHMKNILFFEKNSFFICFLKNKNAMYFYFFIYKKIILKFLFIFCSFCYSKIFLKVGLGFRKKYSKKWGIYVLSIGRRRWVSFIPSPASYFFNVRRRSIYLFANTKQKLYYFLIHLKYLRKETVYKYKGIMTLTRIFFKKRISRSIIFARRVKFKKMKLKLTKKQRQRK